MSITEFDKWKEALGKAVNIGENFGMSDNTINNITASVGSFLAKNTTPSNDEEKLLHELWNAANSHDKHVLAKLVVKITKNDTGIYFYGKRKDHLTVRLERGGTDSPYEYQAE